MKEPTNMNTFEATIRIHSPGGATMLVEARVAAINYFQARLLLERQYGVGSLVGTPVKI